MKREIPQDPAEYAKLVRQVSLRMQSSADWYFGKRDRWRRCREAWNRYPDRPEQISEQDEYEIKVGYGFGVLEMAAAKITEPLLNMAIPFGVFPNDFGDQGKADKFADICRDFYSKPHVQMGKRRSKKEMCIKGTRAEVDEWLHVEEPGKRWGKVEVMVEQEIEGQEGKKATMPQMIDAEVDTKITTYYGFNTRYPRIEDIYPEPNRSTLDTGQKTDVSWYVEDLGELALEDMAREMIYDPATKTTRPRYDFAALIKDKGAAAEKRYAQILNGSGGLVPDGLAPIITPVHDWNALNNEGDNTSRRNPNDATSLQSFEDRDKIWVAQMRTKTEIVTVAQGKYIIERIVDPWHRPRLGLRFEVYTVDTESIYGIGALDPILDELDELNITRSLGMQGTFRLINKMIAVKEKAIVSMNDLDSRAGGVVRINDEVNSASEAIHAIVQPSNIQEMLSAESNTKGGMEFATGILDGSPGVQGTKQNHKTKGGMEVVVNNLNTRFATNQAYGLINEALAGESMSYFFAQFAWEPVSYSRLTEDGSTVYEKFTKDDIDTEGRGFRFLVTVDPVWGDTRAQRQDAQDLYELGLGYEKWRMESKDPEAKKLVLSEVFGDLLKKHGRRDLSKIFVRPDGEIDPGQEFNILSNGGVVDGCKGDLRHHITIHLLQAKAPNLQKAMQAGKADPQTATNLLRLVAQAQAELMTFLKDPQGAAQEKLSRAGMAHPGVAE